MCHVASTNKTDFVARLTDRVFRVFAHDVVQFHFCLSKNPHNKIQLVVYVGSMRQGKFCSRNYVDPVAQQFKCTGLMAASNFERLARCYCLSPVVYAIATNRALMSIY